MTPPLIPVLVEDLKTDQTVWCSFYAVPREGEHVEVFGPLPRHESEEWRPDEPLFTGNVRAVLWSSRDPRPTVRIK